MNALQLATLGIYAIAFGALALLVGRALRSRGKVFLTHTFQDRPAIAESVDFLLALGFYIVSAGLLLWNLGIEPTESPDHAFHVGDLVQTVALRLGISIFVVAIFHTLNILVLAILNRKTIHA